MTSSQAANRKRAAQSSDEDSANREYKPRAAKLRALVALRDNSNNEQYELNFTTGKADSSGNRERKQENSENDRGHTQGRRARSLDR